MTSQLHFASSVFYQHRKPLPLSNAAEYVGGDLSDDMLCVHAHTDTNVHRSLTTGFASKLLHYPETHTLLREHGETETARGMEEPIV